MSDTGKILFSLAAICVALFGGQIFSSLRSLIPALLPAARPQGGGSAVDRPVGDDEVSFVDAIDALAAVRNRLVKTGCLSEEAAGAIEKITHALIAGTDK